MKVQLNIEDDKELREQLLVVIDRRLNLITEKYVNGLIEKLVIRELNKKLPDIIRGQMIQMVRRSTDELTKKLKGVDLETLIRQQVADLFVQRFGSAKPTT